MNYYAVHSRCIIGILPNIGSGLSEASGRQGIATLCACVRACGHRRQDGAGRPPAAPRLPFRLFRHAKANNTRCAALCSATPRPVEVGVGKVAVQGPGAHRGAPADWPTRPPHGAAAGRRGPRRLKAALRGHCGHRPSLEPDSPLAQQCHRGLSPDAPPGSSPRLLRQSCSCSAMRVPTSLYRGQRSRGNHKWQVGQVPGRWSPDWSPTWRPGGAPRP